MALSSGKIARLILANTVACLILMLGGLILRTWYGQWGRMFMWVGIVGNVLGLMFVPRIRRYRAAEVEADGFRVCPQREYSLQGSAASGRCPECGEEYDPGLLVSKWHALLRIRRKQKRCKEELQ